jgi:hypothetical protein
MKVPLGKIPALAGSSGQKWPEHRTSIRVLHSNFVAAEV